MERKYVSVMALRMMIEDDFPKIERELSRFNKFLWTLALDKVLNKEEENPQLVLSRSVFEKPVNLGDDIIRVFEDASR